MPSTCGALTSARRCSSVRTAVRSIFSIASASGASAAADRPILDSRTADAIRTKDLRRIVIPAHRLRHRSNAKDTKDAEATTPSEPSQRQKLVDLALAVGELVETHADLVEQRQMQVGQRRRLRVLDVSSALLP